MNRGILAQWVVTTLVILGLLWVPEGLAIERQVEEAVLRHDWPMVFARLQADATQARDPVVRLLLGHASLATNQNNASLILFLSVQTQDDLQQWTAWTVQLLQTHPQNPVALYLVADAEARAGRFAEARAGFTRAVELQPDFALARNARGIVHVLTKAWDDAWTDFYMTTTRAPDFADAYVNLGTLSVLQEVALQQGDAALKAFNHALTLNPQFALAYNGRGCLYFGSGQFDRATADFRQAFQLPPTLVVAALNEGIAASYAGELHTLARLAQSPGMALESRLEQQETALRTQVSATTTPIPANVLAALPHMSREQQQAVIAQYGGPENIIQAVQCQIEANQLEALKINRDSQTLGGQIAALEKLQFGNARMRAVVAIISVAAEATQHGWGGLGVEVLKHGAEALTENWTAKVVLGALTGNPVTSTVSSGSYALEAYLKDASGGGTEPQGSPAATHG
jgi:tetratricopeptide (TPR) repeat protein